MNFDNRVYIVLSVVYEMIYKGRDNPLQNKKRL